jgi:hypothetical protein
MSHLVQSILGTLSANSGISRSSSATWFFLGRLLMYSIRAWLPWTYGLILAVHGSSNVGVWMGNVAFPWQRLPSSKLSEKCWHEVVSPHQESFDEFPGFVRHLETIFDSDPCFGSKTRRASTQPGGEGVTQNREGLSLMNHSFQDGKQTCRPSSVEQYRE